MPDIKHFDPDATLDTVVRLFWQQGVATTGIQDIVTATGLNRSSLYATFGGKQELYLTALRRYLEQRSQPMFRRLAQDERGLPAIAEFFDGLIEARCSGEYARWGCMVSNAHAGAENGDPDVRAILDRHHQELRDAMYAALVTAEAAGQLAAGAAPGAAADLLALLAYGVNLRSRAGAEAKALLRTVTVALESIGRPAAA
ncbi:TetR/AcrR family transcriptional regulator [Streptomyces roseochromogenus]|uniref:TetR family transcriptional regulator n=1 Tax=Streptomyces roseochromogenus subsp. oscitans DS 12.976 TaxID=1352936 RepID=V6JG49_STRRC|nr:TetR/AcrR family transcriptional regulator [Streptomyces roseochromogenus]EST18820.1 TetR family transcriptional regulator [Streptomyces roseochromogenus subsp. oscitans DS 12.976]